MPHARITVPTCLGGWPYAAPLASLWLIPWFDRLALQTITRGYMPASRAWAAALAAEGSVERFWAELPGSGRPGAALRRAIVSADERRRRYDDADAAWRDAFFANADKDPRETLERRRRHAAQRLMAARVAFLPLVLAGRAPPVKWDIPERDEVSRRHSHRLGRVAFPPPPMPDVARSRDCTGPHGTEFWLRFASPGAGDHAWAHVYEPRGGGDPPTLIFLHGISVEPEFLPIYHDPLPTLSAHGVRVIRPEGPWHGRRRSPGAYGGEPIIARAPVGFLDLFAAWVSEVAVLVAWARSTSAGPVAIGGVSLGALTAQIAATAAGAWSTPMRPDGLLLVATNGEIGRTLSTSRLAQIIGMPQQLAEHGWTPETIAPWRVLAEPKGVPAVPSDRIVMVLGNEDVVAPFPGGLALAQSWDVPAERLFVTRRGHFAAGLSLGADTRPLQRLFDAMM